MPIYLEIIGYLASILVLISLTMSSVLKLRLINLAGAIFFFIYGLLLQAYPILITNFIIILINLYYLHKMYTSKAYFKLLPVSSHSDYLDYFLDFYHDDINKLEPDYKFLPSDNQLILFILRDMVPAGLFIGKRDSQGVFNIYLDYVIPAYRDAKIGRHLFYHSEFFQKQKIHTLISSPNSEEHQKYLKHMGFAKELDANGELVYCLNLTVPQPER